MEQASQKIALEGDGHWIVSLKYSRKMTQVYLVLSLSSIFESYVYPFLLFLLAQ